MTNPLSCASSTHAHTYIPPKKSNLRSSNQMETTEKNDQVNPTVFKIRIHVLWDVTVCR